MVAAACGLDALLQRHGQERDGDIGRAEVDSDRNAHAHEANSILRSRNASDGLYMNTGSKHVAVTKQEDREGHRVERTNTVLVSKVLVTATNVKQKANTTWFVCGSVELGATGR